MDTDLIYPSVNFLVLSFLFSRISSFSIKTSSRALPSKFARAWFNVSTCDMIFLVFMYNTPAVAKQVNASWSITSAWNRYTKALIQGLSRFTNDGTHMGYMSKCSLFKIILPAMEVRFMLHATRETPTTPRILPIVFNSLFDFFRCSFWKVVISSLL